jgi:hypothetical protein
MKYLKRFNEELSPSLLRKSAKKAEEKGGYYKTDIAPKMTDYADLLEWKENVKNSEKNGVIQLELRTGVRRQLDIDQPNYIGNFYPEVSFGLDMLNDHLDNEEGDKSIYLTIFINAVVTTEEGLNEMNEAIDTYVNSKPGTKHKYKEGGKIWMAYSDLQITLENGTFAIHSLDFYDNDGSVVDVKILNRRSSGLIRTAIINEFNSDYEIHFQGEGHSEKVHFENAKEAIEAILAKHGLSSEYGISYEDIYEAIIKTPASTFMFKTDW